jgi:hypothetical protein
MFGDYEGDGDGYRPVDASKHRWQTNIGWTDSRTLYPNWGIAAVEAAVTERRRILRMVYAIEDRRNIMRDRSSVASKYRWETRDAYDAAAKNRSITDAEVEVLSNTAWWAEQDYIRAERANSALFTASMRMQERLEAFDKADKHESVVVSAHWHGPHCQTCKDANLVLQALYK